MKLYPLSGSHPPAQVGLSHSSKIGNLSLERARARQEAVFGTGAFQPADSPIDLYKFRYPSKNMLGRRVTLSALLALPKHSAPKGLIVYCHGTMTERAASPSKYTGKQENSEAELAALAFATGGYAALMPDYLGHGDHLGFHPYPLGKVNSDSVIDAIKPARELAARAHCEVGESLFITGYSEGGAVAMWATKKAEAIKGLEVARSVPMSGPYDLKDTIVDWLLEQTTSSLTLAFKVLAIAYSVYGLHKNLIGIRLGNYFVPSFAPYLPKVFDDKGRESEISKRLALKAVQLGAIRSVERIITPRFKQALQKRDAKDPLVRAFIENSCYDWSPKTKMRLVYLPVDTIVVQQHALKAITAMRQRGVSEDVMSVSALKSTELNHVTAMAPAMVVSKQFIDSGR